MGWKIRGQVVAVVVVGADVQGKKEERPTGLFLRPSQSAFWASPVLLAAHFWSLL